MERGRRRGDGEVKRIKMCYFNVPAPHKDLMTVYCKRGLKKLNSQQDDYIFYNFLCVCVCDDDDDDTMREKGEYKTENVE